MIFRSNQEVHFVAYDRYAQIRFTHHANITLAKAYTFRRSQHGVFLSHTSINTDLYSPVESFVINDWRSRGLWGWLGISRQTLRIGFIVGELGENYDMYLLRDDSDLFIGNVVQVSKSNIEPLPDSFLFEAVCKEKFHNLTFQQ